MQSDQSTEPEEIGTGAASKRLRVTAQTVRDWLREGRLRGRQTSTGRWLVEVLSIEELASEAPGANRAGGPLPASIEGRLDQIAEVVADLQKRELISEKLLRQIEKERDEFRSQARAFRAAALELSAAARETDAGVRHLLEVLDRQRGALAQLLTPGSAGELDD